MKSKVFLFFTVLIFSLDSNAFEPVQNFAPEPVYSQKTAGEQKENNARYIFIAHKPSFIFPLSYNFNPNPNSNGTFDKVDNAEVKFQFSFKINLIENFFNHFKLSFGYTNLSFWQLYNKQDSAAFRETNHEPEVFVDFNPGGWSSGDLNLIYRLGFIHQSNGRDVELSRSWNRFFFEVLKDFKYTRSSLKIWHRLKERAKRSPEDSEGDDNPDITDFLGNFELRLTSKYQGNILSLLVRNNLKSDNKGAYELSVSIPVKNNLRAYAQYFRGYGDSLIDYNFLIERFSLGVSITDWL